MSSNDESGRKKKVTAVTSDAPQEEFISPVNVPSKIEPDPKEKPEDKPVEPPQP